jgi:hypothetical protein
MASFLTAATQTFRLAVTEGDEFPQMMAFRYEIGTLDWPTRQMIS